MRHFKASPPPPFLTQTKREYNYFAIKQLLKRPSVLLPFFSPGIKLQMKGAADLSALIIHQPRRRKETPQRI